MDKITKLSIAEKRELFTETAAQMNIHPSAAEKDFWICWTLKELFSISEIKDRIIFKGGTSLSKVFHLIDRFSEDIDLILDWRVIGITDKIAWEERSKTQQGKFNEKINLETQKYLNDKLLPLLQKNFSTKLDSADFSLTCDQAESQIIRFYYPCSIEEAYLRPEIQLEIGSLASWLPHQNYKITPYAAEKFKKVFTNPFVEVAAIDAERTFWEKATILHQEAHRKSSQSPLRYSRHYYDMHMMSGNDVKNRAFTKLDLLKDVVEFKKKFYYSSWAKYDLAKPGTFCLLPPDTLVPYYKDDYVKMRNMIFGEYPSFDVILDSLEKLEQGINNL